MVENSLEYTIYEGNLVGPLALQFQGICGGPVFQTFRKGSGFCFTAACRVEFCNF